MSTGDLSPRLAELARPSLRSAPLARQAKKLSLARNGPGSLVREGNRVLVEVRFDRGAAASLDDLRSAGAKIINVSTRYQTVTVAAKPGELRQLSDVPHVAGVTEVLAPITAATCPSGAVVSEGDQQLRADEARATPSELDGAGVTVGILSDSFDRDEVAQTTEEEDIETADLPGAGNSCGHLTQTALLDDSEAKGEDEGRAMAQIVHDLAPGASLAFASAFTGILGFAQNIEDLRDVGANVIVDDVAYAIEPFFQEGPVGVAISDVAESGVAYFSSAGNNNLFDLEGNEIGSWETQQYRDSGGCPPAVEALPGVQGTHCLDFNPGSQIDKTLGIKVAPGVTLSVDLQWAEPWEGVETDLDVFLLNATGGLIGASAGDNVAISQRPVEFLQWENESGTQRTVQLVVNRYAGNAPRLKLAFLENGFGVTGIEYPKSTEPDRVGPTIFGHNGAVDAISVGAVPFDDSSLVEDYSSRGPVTHYFGPVLNSNEPAEAQPAEMLAKPDVVATDCGVTTFFGFPVSEEAGVAWRFCGTSAAAPHAAAVAALMTDAKTATPAEIHSALFASAVPVGEFGACAAGAGLIDAVGAIQALLDSETGGEPGCSSPVPEVSIEEAQAGGNWGTEAPPSPPAPPDVEASPPTPTPPSPVPAGDQTPPRTFFRLRPPKTLLTPGSTARAVFRFGSNEADVSFLCKFDRKAFRGCRSRIIWRPGLGPHVLRVKARDAAGNTDGTPAVSRFQVKQSGDD